MRVVVVVVIVVIVVITIKAKVEVDLKVRSARVAGAHVACQLHQPGGLCASSSIMRVAVGNCTNRGVCCHPPAVHIVDVAIVVVVVRLLI